MLTGEILSTLIKLYTGGTLSTQIPHRWSCDQTKESAARGRGLLSEPWHDLK